MSVAAAYPVNSASSICCVEFKAELVVARPDFPRTFDQLGVRFAIEPDCWQYLLASRWPDGFRCPRCGHDEAYALATRSLLQCRSCRQQTSVTAYLVTTHTPGFSALQLQRQLGLSRYETAFVMLQKLRRAMLRPGRDPLFGTLEVDET